MNLIWKIYYIGTQIKYITVEDFDLPYIVVTESQALEFVSGGKKAHEFFSPQALANIAEGRKHRVFTPEGKAKLIEAAREVGKRPKSEEHKEKIRQTLLSKKKNS